MRPTEVTPEEKQPESVSARDILEPRRDLAGQIRRALEARELGKELNKGKPLGFIFPQVPW